MHKSSVTKNGPESSCSSCVYIAALLWVCSGGRDLQLHDETTRTGATRAIRAESRSHTCRVSCGSRAGLSMYTRFVFLTLTLAVARIAGAATVQPLVHQPPSPVGLPILLTDGSVMFQAAIDGTRWARLTPDIHGSYLNGTWSALAPFPALWNYSPYAFASAVLADGRV